MQRAPLLVQWLRIHLPTQGTWSSIPCDREDPTCSGATKPMCHNSWASVLEPMSCNYWSPRVVELTFHTREATTMRSRGTIMRSSPCRPQLEKAMHSNEDLTQPKIRVNKWINLYKKERKRTCKEEAKEEEPAKEIENCRVRREKKMYDFERIACWKTGQSFYYMPHTENTKCWWGTTGVITHHWYKCEMVHAPFGNIKAEHMPTSCTSNSSPKFMPKRKKNAHVRTINTRTGMFTAALFIVV